MKFDIWHPWIRLVCLVLGGHGLYREIRLTSKLDKFGIFFRSHFSTFVQNIFLIWSEKVPYLSDLELIWPNLVPNLTFLVWLANQIAARDKAVWLANQIAARDKAVCVDNQIDNVAAQRWISSVKLFPSWNQRARSFEMSLVSLWYFL